MVNGFLNIARLESGKIMMDIAPVDLAELVSVAVEENVNMVATHQIKAHYNGVLLIDADADKLSQVINNLISNAIKYSPNETEIFIECYSEGTNAVFKITDHGMGISPNDLPKLFDRFYRVENLKTATVAGFGIGLYLSAEIIQRHHGRIWAESELGKGASFYFSVPLKAVLS